jgi:photosystem II protein
MAEIQFSKGLTEKSVPDIRLTRARNGSRSTATFSFQSPSIFNNDVTEDITGMYLVDEEGEIVTREVKGTFVNGKPSSIQAVLIMNTQEEWERFLRFMDRYAQEQGLQLTQNQE